MSLVDKQARFTVMTADLIHVARAMGYQLTYGWAWRPEEVSQYYASQGTGIANSLHQLRLAVDFNLFRDGQYLYRTEDHQPLGEFWQSIGGTWGGEFNDGNHYSLAHEGRK
jgi:hypothetical protein